MPALAMRFTGGTAGRPQRSTHAAGTAADTRHTPVDQEDSACVARLAAEFLAVPDGVVRRCLADAGARAEHLGVDVTAPGVVERLARERLLALVHSVPPSGAPPTRR